MKPTAPLRKSVVSHLPETGRLSSRRVKDEMMRVAEWTRT